MAKKSKLRKRKLRKKEVAYSRKVAKRNQASYDRDMMLAGLPFTPTDSRRRKTRIFKIQMGYTSGKKSYDGKRRIK